MRDALKPLVSQVLDIGRMLDGKAMPSVLGGQQWSGTQYVDSYKRTREPTPNELMAELKGTAWACISLNSAVCANNPPALYVASGPDDPPAKCRTRKLGKKLEDKLRKSRFIPAHYRKAYGIEEVTDHPLAALLQQVNPLMNGFDLWELTTLYQEVHGSAYWYLSPGPFGVPDEIWILPTQNVTPKRLPNSPNIVDYYQYRTGAHEQRFDPSQIIHFRYPDPRDPYSSGLAPLRACIEQQMLKSDYSAMKKAIYENRAVPGVIVSPDEVIGEEERDRLESQWNTKFRRGGTGRALVAESPMRVTLLSQSLGDLAQLAEMRATHEDICCAFHVPIAFFTTNTNMANLQAGNLQHMLFAIGPRLTRRDEKLNEQLLPLYDPSGRLFIASEDPTPGDASAMLAEKQMDLQYGVISINERRDEIGLPPVPWGNVPWVSTRWAPMDQPRDTGVGGTSDDQTGASNG